MYRIEKNRVLSILLCLCILMTFGPAISVQAANDDQIKASITVTPDSVYEDDVVDVDITLEGIPYQGKVQPTDVVLVIDRSGSMSNYVNNMITAAKGFVDGVDTSKHRIGVVDYDSKAETFALSNNKTKVKEYIDSIANKSQGGTDIAAAIDAAANLLKSKRSSAEGAIVLMTDGQSDEAAALQSATRAKAMGYIIYTVAFSVSASSSANEMLKKVATSEADHYFVDSPTALPSVYQKISVKIGYANAKDVVVSQYINDQFEYVNGSADANIPQPYINGQKLIWKMNQLGQGTTHLSYQMKVKDTTVPGTYNHVSSGSVVYTDYNGNSRSIVLDKISIKVSKHAPQLVSINQNDFDADGGENVLIQGKYIQDKATVKLGNTVISNAVISNNTISFIMPSHAVGTDNIIVINPDKQVSNSLTVNFTSSAPLPTLTLTPSNGPEKKSTKVVASGIKFAATSTSQLKVKVGGVDVKIISYDKNTGKTIFYVPNSFAAGNVDIVFTDKDGRQYIGKYTYNSTVLPKMVITSVTPDNGAEKKSVKVTVEGNNFASSSSKMKVTVGGIEVKLLTCTATKMVFYVPNNLTAGTHAIEVTRTDTKETATSQYTCTTTIPINDHIQITSVSPASGEEKVSTKVTIDGKNFAGSTSKMKVTVGGTEVKLLTCTTTKLIFYVPNTFAAGAQTIEVTRTDTNESATAQYTYTQKTIDNTMQITSISPASGEEKTSTKVTVDGKNFADSTSKMKVTVGGTEVKLLTCTTTKLIFYVPNTFTAGVQPIEITRTDTNQTVTGQFTYIQPQVPPVTLDIIQVTPQSGVEGVSQKVTITGTGFVNGGNFKVMLGTKELNPLTVTATSIIVYVPTDLTAGTYPLKVVNRDGTTKLLPNAYEYTAAPVKPAPNVTGVSPVAGTANTTYKVTLEGSNFKGTTKATVVTFDGQPVKLLTNTDNKLIFYPPKLSSGTYDIVITNSNGISVTISYKVN